MRIGTLIAVVAMVVLSGCGIALLVIGNDALASAEAAGRARPVALAVDLSKPGRYEVEFEQAYTGSHYQAVVLDVERSAHGELSPRQWLDGFKGRVSISDGGGGVVVEQQISSEDVRDGAQVNLGDDAPQQSRVILADFPPPAKGRYRFHFDVTSPPAALPAGQHVLTLRYQFCGLEFLPARMLRGGAWIMFLTAGLVGLVWYRQRRRRRSRAVCPTMQDIEKG